MSLQGSGSVAEMNNLLDNIAKATIEVFQQSADLNNNSSNSGMGLFNPNGIGSTDASSTRQNGIKTFLRYFFLQFYWATFTCSQVMVYFYLHDAVIFHKASVCEEITCKCQLSLFYNILKGSIARVNDVSVLTMSRLLEPHRTLRVD